MIITMVVISETFPQMHRAIELAIITHRRSTHKMMTYIGDDPVCSCI